MKEILIKKGVLVAFGELFLKSKGVRNLFIKRLIGNLVFFLKKGKINYKINLFRERIFIETEEISKTEKIIKNIFGIAWFAPVFYFPEKNIEKLSDFVKKNYLKWIKKNQTFAIILKIDKSLNFNREKIIKKIAEKIKRKVNLSRPHKKIFIELRKNNIFIYFKKKKGAGGLPIGTSGKVLTLISGGIDSPVAAYLSAKRGGENIWLHFHSYPLVSRASIEKIEELVKIFLNYQPKLKLYLIPFASAQKIIKTESPFQYRILLYRRLMFKIAEKISQKEKCLALITGESLGQVSSQTLPNIGIIEEAVKIPVLRPLIEMDKEEIIMLAKKIKTYKISVKPQEDCCSLFATKGQTGQGNMKKIKELEKKLNTVKLIKNCLKGLEIKKY